MNEISFENAPVVELIAELRWTPPGLSQTAPGQVTLALGPEVEEFFLRFGAEVAKLGYTRAERVVPPGIPLIMHQVACRFRLPDNASTLLQVGPGLFSANALQPYKSWSTFRPTVETGIAALLATRGAAEQQIPFSTVSLRYINAFTGELLAGRAPAAFLSEVLGFQFALPTPIKGLVDATGQVSSNANVLIPVANTSKNMSLAVGDGQLNAEPAAMFDITVSETTPIPSTSGDVMKALSASRDIIHKCFLKLTEPVANLMKPRV